MKFWVFLLSAATFFSCSFLFAGSISITSPTSGQIVKYGENFSVKWKRKGDLGDSVWIYLKRKDSPSGIKIITNEAPNNGIYIWKPDLHNGEYVLVVSVRADADNPAQESSMSAPFKIQGLDPELSIDCLKVEPKKNYVNKQITLEVNVCNSGLSNSQPTTARLEIKGPIRRNIDFPIEVLAGHQKKVLTYKYSLPKYGIYRNVFTVNNNRRQIVYGVNPLADLAITARKYRRVKLLKQSTITLKVKNRGEVLSPKSKLRFWIQGKGTKNYEVPSLQPGKVYFIRRKEYWKTSGKCRFSAHIDEANKIAEKSDTNNKFNGMIEVG